MVLKKNIVKFLNIHQIKFEIIPAGFLLEKGSIVISKVEDVFLAKKDVLSIKETDEWSIAESRLMSFCGLNQTIFARKTKIDRIDAFVASEFLSVHHYAGSVKTKYKFGLFIQSELVAIACFSGKRNYKSQKSIELIRYAAKSGYTIVGGLSKLLKHVFDTMEISEIMTYVDREYSLGQSFRQLGFKETGISKPIGFRIENGQRLYSPISTDFLNLGNYILKKTKT